MSFFVPFGKTIQNPSRSPASSLRGGRNFADVRSGAAAAAGGARGQSEEWEEDARHGEMMAGGWTEVVSREDSMRDAYLEKCQTDCLAHFSGLPDQATLQRETTVTVPSATIVQMTREIARMRFQLKQASRIASEHSRGVPELRYLARKLSNYKKL